jgi:tight adherence protein C
MNIDHIMFYALIVITFLAVVTFVFGVRAFFEKRYVGKRLNQVLDQMQLSAFTSNNKMLGRRWNAILDSLSKMSLPKEGWQDSRIHLKFLRAGIRGAMAPRIYFALKSVLTLGVPVLIGLFFWPYSHQLGFAKFSLILLALASLGYYLPEIYLDSRTKRRLKDCQHGLPDLIDLLVICTESGLGLDAALNRVSKEIVRTNPYLAEELYLTNLEIRAGSGRNAALKGLALRVNLDAVHNLVSMLVQADRFGTSVADSLRVQAGLMRIQRMQVAEEIASKIPVKMLVPMIFFIFPALIIVIIGSAIIQIRTLF